MAIADFSREDFGFIPLPNGKYLMSVKETEISDRNGKDRAVIKMAVDDDMSPGMDALAGRKYTEFLYLTEAALWKFVWFAKSCGLKFNGKLDTDSPVFRKIVASLKGRQVVVQLEFDKEHNNNKSMAFERPSGQEEFEVTDYEEAPGFLGQPAKPEDIAWNE
jgi:hypothetical protein